MNPYKILGEEWTQAMVPRQTRPTTRPTTGPSPTYLN